MSCRLPPFASKMGIAFFAIGGFKWRRTEWRLGYSQCRRLCLLSLVAGLIGCRHSSSNPTHRVFWRLKEDCNNIAVFILRLVERLSKGHQGRRSITHCVQEGAGENFNPPPYRHMAMTATENIADCRKFPSGLTKIQYCEGYHQLLRLNHSSFGLIGLVGSER